MVNLYIFLHSTPLKEDLPIGLALCLVPFLLGWLFSYIFHRVSGLQLEVKQLTEDKTNLTNRVEHLDADLTDTRVKLAQAESEIDTAHENIKTLKNSLIIAESERNLLKIKLEGENG